MTTADKVAEVRPDALREVEEVRPDVLGEHIIKKERDERDMVKLRPVLRGSV